MCSTFLTHGVKWKSNMHCHYRFSEAHLILYQWDLLWEGKHCKIIDWVCWGGGWWYVPPIRTVQKKVPPGLENLQILNQSKACFDGATAMRYWPKSRSESPWPSDLALRPMVDLGKWHRPGVKGEGLGRVQTFGNDCQI